MRYIKYIEDTYKCSGVCEQSLFYFSLPLSEGPPENLCFKDVWTDVQTLLLWIGVGPMIAGILIFLSYCCMLPIFSYNREDDLIE